MLFSNSRVAATWFISLFASDALSTPTWRRVIVIVGFALLILACLGVLLLLRKQRQDVGKDNLSESRSVRVKGKLLYVSTEVVKGLLVGLVAVSWPVISDYSKAGTFELVLKSWWIYSTIILTCIGAMYYAAVRTWNSYEKELEAKRAIETDSHSL